MSVSGYIDYEPPGDRSLGLDAVILAALLLLGAVCAVAFALTAQPCAQYVNHPVLVPAKPAGMTYGFHYEWTRGRFETGWYYQDGEPAYVTDQQECVALGPSLYDQWRSR